MRGSIFLIILIGFISCSKSDNSKPAIPGTLTLESVAVNGVIKGYAFYNVANPPSLKFKFAGGAINQTIVSFSITFKDDSGTPVTQLNYSFENDSTLTISPSVPLKPITKYIIQIDTS